jgi:ribosomal-protein-alanine N-acetyltransferase
MGEINFPIIETKRLILREIINDDAEAIYQYLSDEDVNRYLEGNTDSVEEAEGYISWCRDTYNHNTDIRWGIELKENGKLIGDCGFGHIDEPKSPTELGYILSKDYWNHGYMSEALGEILRYGFQTLNLHRIQAWTHPDNKASARVLLKHGFIHEGFLREYVYVWHRNVYIDADIYSLLAKDYQ